MNRTIKEADRQRYHYEGHDQLRQNLTDFVAAYIFGRRLKTLKASNPTKPSAKPGAENLIDLRQIRPTKFRDQTSKF